MIKNLEIVQNLMDKVKEEIVQDQTIKVKEEMIKDLMDKVKEEMDQDLEIHQIKLFQVKEFWLNFQILFNLVHQQLLFLIQD